MTQAIIHQMELFAALLDSSAVSDRLQLPKARIIATKIAALVELTDDSAMELTTHAEQIFGGHETLVIDAVRQRLESDARVEAAATSARQLTVTKPTILLNKSDWDEYDTSNTFVIRVDTVCSRLQECAVWNPRDKARKSVTVFLVYLQFQKTGTHPSQRETYDWALIVKHRFLASASTLNSILASVFTRNGWIAYLRVPCVGTPQTIRRVEQTSPP